MTLRQSARADGPSSEPKLALGRTTSVPALVAKIIFLGLMLGLAVATVPALISMRSWMMLSILIIYFPLVWL